jgi:hypothetical protein
VLSASAAIIIGEGLELASLTPEIEWPNVALTRFDFAKYKSQMIDPTNMRPPAVSGLPGCAGSVTATMI